jgi:hypothetical protein
MTAGAVLLAAVAVTAAGCTVGAASDELTAIRRATERYRDVKAALADGYLRDPADMCATAAMEGQPAWLGAMGIHFFRPDLLAITGTSPRVDGNGTHTDFMKPGVLIYEPESDGSLRLVAVENLVFEQAWRKAGHTSPPTFQGREYYHMVDNPLTPADEAHGFAPHYELHIWSERANPAGAYAEFNPKVTCRYHRPQPKR